MSEIPKTGFVGARLICNTYARFRCMMVQIKEIHLSEHIVENWEERKFDRHPTSYMLPLTQTTLSRDLVLFLDLSKLKVLFQYEQVHEIMFFLL